MRIIVNIDDDSDGEWAGGQVDERVSVVFGWLIMRGKERRKRKRKKIGRI